jgi:hypothetical protein
VGLSLGVPYVSSSASILTGAIKNENSRTITPSLARSAHCLSLSCVLSCSEGDIVASRLRLTAPSFFRLNTSSYLETVSQGRQVTREGEGSVRIVDYPSGPPPRVLSRTAVMLSFFHRPLQRVEGDMDVSDTYKSLPPLAKIPIRTVLCRLRTIRDPATLLRRSLAHPLEYFTNRSAIQPLYIP